MKKLIASLAVVSLISLTACNNDKKTTEPQTTTDSTASASQSEPSQADSQISESTASAVPDFSDPEIKKFAEDYTAFVKDLTVAYESKNIAKATELQQKAMDWANRSTEISKKLVSNPGDAQKFAEYTQKINLELQKAMSAK